MLICTHIYVVNENKTQCWFSIRHLYLSLFPSQFMVVIIIDPWWLLSYLLIQIEVPFIL